MSVGDYISAHWKCSSWKIILIVGMLFRRDLKFRSSKPKYWKERGKCFAVFTVTFLISLLLLHRHSISFWVFFFRQALLSFSSEMNPRCWRQNNNSKCFTLLNGVDVDTGRKLWVGVQSCQGSYLSLLDKEKDLCPGKLRRWSSKCGHLKRSYWSKKKKKPTHHV